jgi:hypothetical protein
LTLTTFENNGGIVTLKANTPNIRQVDGTLTMLESATCGTLLQVDGGTVDWRSNGTITAATVGNGGTITFAVDIRPRTVTNVTLNAGAAWLDPARTVTYTNPMTLNRCAIADLRAFDVGTHVTVAVAAAA